LLQIFKITGIQKVGCVLKSFSPSYHETCRYKRGSEHRVMAAEPLNLVLWKHQILIQEERFMPVKISCDGNVNTWFKKTYSHCIWRGRNAII